VTVNVDVIRTLFTYGIALVVIVGSGWLLITPSQVPAEQLLPFVTGQVGAVIAFIFTERQQAAATKAANGGAALTGAELTALHRRLDAAGIPPEPPPAAEPEG
jgi:hypothetical protein